jgi:hypothetical protein
MNQHQFVSGIRSAVLDQNISLYRDIFAKTESINATDHYWKGALEFYAQLNENQREMLFQITRQIMVDTTSNLLGILDGVNWLEGQEDAFILITENSSEQLNNGLQDLFLSSEENLESRA